MAGRLDVALEKADAMAAAAAALVTDTVEVDVGDDDDEAKEEKSNLILSRLSFRSFSSTGLCGGEARLAAT
jgi:hypothetical protein